MICIQCQHEYRSKALLTDIGTEELAHMEMIAALVYKLVDGADPKEMEAAGWGEQYAQHKHVCKKNMWTGCRVEK